MGTFEGRKVVACKDFIYSQGDSSNYELIEFKKLETSFFGSSSATSRTPAYASVEKVLSSHKNNNKGIILILYG